MNNAAAAAAAANDDSSTPPIPILRRRNSTGTPTDPAKPYHSSSSSSIATTTTATSSSSASSSSSSSEDFELVPTKPSCYTSLRDILPSPAVQLQSPKAPCSAAYSVYEITIRNPLVKHAAWAYLQPMSTFPEADRTTVLHRFWTQFSGVILRLITAAFDCLLLVGTTASQL